MLHSTKIRTIADVSIGVQELGVVKDVKEFSPELEMLGLPNRQDLLH
jgi:hypothetical protein